MTNSDKLPLYFQKYLDERFKRLEDNVNEIKELLKGNGVEGLVEKVEKHDKWIEGLEARMGVVVTILGSLFALAFTLIKDVVVNILKVR
jgi:hypothetical protein